MTDLIREAADLAADMIDAALQEQFTGAGLAEVLPCDHKWGCTSPVDHDYACPADRRPAVAALIEARVAAARPAVLLEAAKLICPLCRNEYGRDDQPIIPHLDEYKCWSHGRWGRCHAEEIWNALASSEPGKIK